LSLRSLVVHSFIALVRVFLVEVLGDESTAEFFGWQISSHFDFEVFKWIVLDRVVNDIPVVPLVDGKLVLELDVR